MDQLDLAVARQIAAERQSNVIRAAEQRRMLSERAALHPEPVVAPTPAGTTPRLSLRGWLASHLHLALQRPAAR